MILQHLSTGFLWEWGDKVSKATRIRIVLVFIVVALLAPLFWLLTAKQFRDAEKLIDAIEKENVEQVKLLLDSGVDPNQTNIPPLNVWSIVEMSADRPLSVACKTGNLEIVEALIANGATAEKREHTGWSPLKMTLFHTHADDFEIVKLLLSNGADPQTVEPDNLIVFDAANMYPILFGSEGYTTGYDADIAADITAIVELLLMGNDINLRTESGDTLLMYAAARGNLCLAEYLIAHGCDVSLVNDQGKTAHDIAIEHNKEGVIELLEKTID
jgi:ankyrin repeat protein